MDVSIPTATDTSGISAKPPTHQHLSPLNTSSGPVSPAPIQLHAWSIAASVDIGKELVRWPVVREGRSKTHPKGAGESQELIEERLLANPKQLSSPEMRKTKENVSKKGLFNLGGIAARSGRVSLSDFYEVTGA
ncbi:hypothetical protein HNY73_022805 [Argiope bruennichi]|uniref:Uncharacterized protein n=1 Tax=Argiope bruennichi TaxID=94029 RepID=A0A8T0E3C4_ARGBR|nr:hypothetical protein HNY73_022805 [Argiope bruennichi]